MKINFKALSEGLDLSLSNACLTRQDYGQCQEIYHQADKKARLVQADTLSVVTVSNKYQVQLAYLVDRIVPVATQRKFGTGGPDNFNADGRLLVASYKAEALPIILRELSHAYLAEVEDVDSNTLRVLRDAWHIDVGSEQKNYDPALWAWSIRCRFLNVELRRC